MVTHFAHLTPEVTVHNTLAWALSGSADSARRSHIDAAMSAEAPCMQLRFLISVLPYFCTVLYNSNLDWHQFLIKAAVSAAIAGSSGVHLIARRRKRASFQTNTFQNSDFI